MNFEGSEGREDRLFTLAVVTELRLTELMNPLRRF